MYSDAPRPLQERIPALPISAFSNRYLLTIIFYSGCCLFFGGFQPFFVGMIGFAPLFWGFFVSVYSPLIL